MTTSARIVSTSDRYDLTWEREFATAFDDIDLDLVASAPSNESDLIRLAADADALLISSREAISSALLDALPAVRVIGRNSVGLDNIDLEACTKHGVVVTHFPHYCTHEVADHAIAFIYALNRRIVELDRDLREGAWVRHEYHMDRILRGPVPPMREQTLGIIGLGRIGQQVARRMRASVSRIIAFDPYVDTSVATSLDVTLVSLADLLSGADIVTLHCPLTPETTGLIDGSALTHMKPGAVLVNTARGPIVDLEALDTALTEGRIAGAALDVFSPEPLPVESMLFSHPTLIMSPHSAYYSERSVETVRRETLLGVIDVLRGYRPKVVANPAVLDYVALKHRPVEESG
jgi:D-3-phosphoglycerate dehydrogenase / 2-oxoglutarate reductase